MEPEVELQSFANREDWLAARRYGIGASEAAALFGCSRWDSPVSLWAKKRGTVADDVEASERMELGLAMEPVVAAIYQRRTERKLWAPATPWTLARHPRVSCLTASVDRWVIEAPDRRDGRGVLEIKNVDAFMADEWDDGPPLAYQIQLQHQLAVTGFAWGSIVGIVGGNRVRHFDINRNAEFIEELEARCLAFWGQVERGEMPEVDDSHHTAEAVKRLHPAENGETVALSPDSSEAWAALEAARATERAAKKAKEAATAKLIAAFGPNSFGKLPDGRTLSAHTIQNAGYTSVVEPFSYRVVRLENEKKKGASKR